jgi:hypothetical protein
MMNLAGLEVEGVTEPGRSLPAGRQRGIDA